MTDELEFMIESVPTEIWVLLMKIMSEPVWGVWQVEHRGDQELCRLWMDERTAELVEPTMLELQKDSNFLLAYDFRKRAALPDLVRHEPVIALPDVGEPYTIENLLKRA